MNTFLPKERQISETKFPTFNNVLMNRFMRHGTVTKISLNPADQDSLNSTAGGNLLERRTQDVLTIIEKKYKVRNSRNKSIVSQVKSSDVNSSSSSEIAKLTHAVNQQTSACLAADGNTFRDNVQGYVSAAAVNYNQGLGYLTSNSIANPRGEFKAITTRSGLVLDGPSVPMPPLFINPDEDERADETLTDPELAEYTIKVAPPLIQKAKPTSLKNYVVHKRDPLHPIIPYPSRRNQEKHQEKDEVQIHNFWQMFKQLHINISLADALILIPEYQKMLKSLLSNKEKLLELANTPLNENCSAVILKKLPEKLEDPGKFLIPCGFSELKCKALADLGASMNLIPLSVWKKLGLPELISTRMALELANRTICTPAGIARDVFVPVGKFTFPPDFVIVDYESDPRVPLSLGRPFLWTARALIDVHGEEMILRDGDERLILNMRHDTSNNKSSKWQSYFSSHTDLTSPEVINPLSGNPAPILEPVIKSSYSPVITSFEESDLIWEEFEAYLASDSFPPRNNDHVDLLLEEFPDELALITFPPGNDDLPFDIESDLREIEYLLNHDPTKEKDSILEDSVDEGNIANPNNNLVDTIPEMFTDEHTLDYSSPPLYDDVDDDLVQIGMTIMYCYDDPFDSKEDKNKESKLLIDEPDPPRSSDFLPSPKCDSVLYEDFSEVDALPSTNNEDKDFNPPLYELPFHKEVLGSETLLSFSSENEEKVFNPGILTSKGVHTSLLPELSHRGSKAFKKKLKQLEPMLYVGDIIQKTNPIVIPDSEETLTLAEESRLKMLLKHKDNMMQEKIKQIDTTPIDYVALNKLYKDFETRFVPQTELSAEQAFWKHNSVNSSEPDLSDRPTNVEVPKELPKVSLVNTSLKKLKYHLANFDVVVKRKNHDHSYH
ncbi:reverse transcriptase domain-containing protein [Tanacetum coccineum]